jgi:hypothetical protein
MTVWLLMSQCSTSPLQPLAFLPALPSPCPAPNVQNHQVAPSQNQKHRNQGTGCYSKPGNCHLWKIAAGKGRPWQTQSLNHFRRDACEVGVIVDSIGVPCVTLCLAAWPGSPSMLDRVTKAKIAQCDLGVVSSSTLQKKQT